MSEMKKFIPCFLIYLIGVIFQLLCSNIQLSFFVFPFNITILLLFFVVVLLCRKTIMFRFLTSKVAALSSIAMIIVNGIILGLVPQYATNSLLLNTAFFAKLGVSKMTSSWIFLIPVVFLTLILIALIIKKLQRFLKRDILFILIHAALLLLIIGVFWGASDEKVFRTVIPENGTEYQAYNEENEFVNLPFAITLETFDIERYPSGAVSQYKAEINIKGSRGERTEILRVNHPVSYQDYEIYLENHKEYYQKTFVILQIVKSPWSIVVKLGLVLLILSFAVIPFVYFKNSKYGLE